ncbi:MAG TPA: glycosyltransferase family 4 protein [Usitatibacter sp.]|nr:glycosyltransferase family 4 protein [Usitatibacter sp.]
MVTPLNAGAPGVARKPRICFVAPTTWPVLSASSDIKVVGGAEVQQSMIAPALAKRGYDVSMICYDYGQADRTEIKGVTIYNMHKPDEGIPVIRYLHPRLTSLWRALTRADADIYYQRTAAGYTGFVAAFCRKHGRKSIYAGASDVDFIPGKQEIKYARDRKIFEYGLRRVDKVITQNPQQHQELLENYGREGTLIPSCYAPPAGAKHDRAGYVLWVASIRPSKRAEIALEIARRLPNYRFVMIGGPDPDRRSQEYFASLKEAARALPNLDIKGFVPFTQAEQYFNGARVFLNTSEYEGFPNTFLQAWSRGIPAVAFVDTGSRRDGELVYDCARDVGEATWKLERLMRDDIHWHLMSQRVQSHFRDTHSVEATIARYEREIAALMGGK